MLSGWSRKRGPLQLTARCVTLPTVAINFMAASSSFQTRSMILYGLAVKFTGTSLKFPDRFRSSQAAVMNFTASSPNFLDNSMNFPR